MTVNPLEIFLRDLVKILSIIRQCAENKNLNSIYFFLRNYAPLKIHHGNQIRSITLKPLEVYSRNWVQI